MAKYIDRYYTQVTTILVLLFVVYLYSMVAYPWFHGGWRNVHAVWYDWQALNVGILAFASTVVLFSITRYNDIQQKHRELIAARAFMPEALSGLSDYCRRSAEFILHLHKWVSERRNEDKTVFNQLSGIQLFVPVPPTDHREVFSKCISLADHNFSEFLYYILSCIQIQNSRLSGLHEVFTGKSTTIYGPDFTLACLLRLCELHQLVTSLYQYSRGEEEFLTVNTLDLEAIKSSILSLNLLQVQEPLEALAEKRLKTKQDAWRFGWRRNSVW